MTNKTKAKPFQRLIVFKLFWITLFWITGVSALSQTGEAVEGYSSDPLFMHASISICFRDAATGEIVASLNPEMSLGSASVMKLVTTATALDLLGPEFSFRTTVSYRGTIDSHGTLNGTIIISGGGDPALGSSHFNDHYGDFITDWRDAVIAAGIKRVNGGVTADASLFSDAPAPGGWSWSDLGNYYGAGAHGLSLYENMFRIHLRTGNEGTIAEITFTEPEIPGYLITNRLVSKGSTDRGYVYAAPYDEKAEIRGTIPVNRDDFVLKASIPDPPLLAAHLLSEALKEAGVEVSGSPATNRTEQLNGARSEPEKSIPLLVTKSPPLIDIITITNRESINLFAENILRLIATAEADVGGAMTKAAGGGRIVTYGSGTTEAPDSGITVADGGGTVSADSAISVVTRFLEERGVESSGLFMDDGSGLSRYNALSSGFITDLLCSMNSNSSYGTMFRSSLPAAGVDGTLKYYFRDPLFSGRLRAKSGTSTRIRNYAGYITTLSGREYTFAVLVNNFDGSPSEVTEKTEKLLLWWIKNR